MPNGKFLTCHKFSLVKQQGEEEKYHKFIQFRGIWFEISIQCARYNNFFSEHFTRLPNEFILSQLS